MKEHTFLSDLKQQLSHAHILSALSKIFGINFNKLLLRIAVYEDNSNFYLIPHTDTQDKILTIIVYISPNSDLSQGTELYDENLNHVLSVLSFPNSAILFQPSKKSFHGYFRKTSNFMRRTLVVNFVKATWQNKDQIAGTLYYLDPSEGGEFHEYR